MKRKYILGGVIVIVVIAVLVLFQSLQKTTSTSTPTTALSGIKSTATTSEVKNMPPSSPLPKMDLTKPIKEIPLQNGGASKAFTITYNNGVLSPSQIVVNQNDQIQLTFATSSVTYDLAASNFGYFLITKDTPIITTATFNGPKEITLACRKYCPQQGTILTEKIIVQ